MTAEQLIYKKYAGEFEEPGATQLFNLKEVQNLMIEFARYHSERALKAANAKAEIELPEGREIQFKHINNLYCNENTFGDTPWKIQYNTVDIGCWKNVTRTDLGKIIDTYNEIKQLVSLD